MIIYNIIWNDMFAMMLTPAVRLFLLSNILFFIADKFILPFTGIFGLRYILSDLFYPFQFVSYMFLHADFGHLFFNMFALFIFGPMIERFWGTKRFVIFYLITGIGAGIIYSMVTFVQMYSLQEAIMAYIQAPGPDHFESFMRKNSESQYFINNSFINAFAADPENSEFINQSIQFAKRLYKIKADVPLIGASGAIFGILMAFGMLFPQTELYIFLIPFPIKAWAYVTFYGILELYSGVRAVEGDNVAHFAHLGGMIFAFALIHWWRKTDNL